MKKILGAVLVCAASAFAAWDYFPVIGESKGEAKVYNEQCRQGGNGGCYENSGFKIRYSPMDKLELMARTGSVIGMRYQIVPAISAGLDVGLPIPSKDLSITPNVQFSTSLTEAILLGTNGEATFHSEDDGGLDLRIGAELDVSVGKSIVWLGLDFNRENLDDDNGGIETVPKIGYIATAGNLSLGTHLGLKFGKDAGHDKHATFFGLDFAVKF